MMFDTHGPQSRNEGTFAKAGLVQNRPFVSSLNQAEKPKATDVGGGGSNWDPEMWSQCQSEGQAVAT